MSGTSLDGVDGVLASITEGGSTQVLFHASCGFTPALRQSLLDLNTAGHDELHRSAQAAHALTAVYRDVVDQLLSMSARSPSEIVAIGAHGQTVRHQPSGPAGYTWQLNHPALLAEWTGIDVVADFRSRDIAAGGQGAPLVPAFHLGAFGHAGQNLAILNIGGISNLSILPGDGQAWGWDCGPGNALMDHWCQKHLNQPFDRDGAWAASGRIHPELLGSLMNEPYLQEPPPKSTGRDLFHPAWLQSHLDLHPAQAEDVQATLTAFTVHCCVQDLRRQAPQTRSLVVCGGGALNRTLMQMLTEQLSGVTVASSEQYGLPPLQVEAAAFAWLAHKCVRREPASLPSVTGARGARVLGAIYPR